MFKCILLLTIAHRSLLLASNVSISIMTKFCDPLLFAQASIYVNNSKISYSHGKSGNITFATDLTDFTVGVKLPGFRYATTIPKCQVSANQCNAAVFLEIQPIEEFDSANEKKALILPKEWISKGLFYLRVIGVEGAGELSFTGDGLAKIQLPIEWNGSTIIFLSFKDGSKATALLDLEYGNRETIIQAGKLKVIELPPRPQFR